MARLSARNRSSHEFSHLGTLKGGLCFEKAGALGHATTWRIRSLNAPPAEQPEAVASLVA
jgi:hypothetical protein